MDGGAWWATVHGVARVGHNLVIKPQGKGTVNLLSYERKQRALEEVAY